MEKLLRSIFVLLVPTSILSLSFFWWKRKKGAVIKGMNNNSELPFDDQKRKHSTGTLISEPNCELEKVKQLENFDVDCKDLVGDELDVLVLNETDVKETRKRIRQQSNCDSAYVEDYSSDGLSMAGSDSNVNKSSDQTSIDPVFEKIQSSDVLCLGSLESIPSSSVINVQDLESENCRCKDWYNPNLELSADYKVMHWGSQPVSDVENDDQSLKREYIDKISSEQLLTVLDDQYNEQRNKLKSHKSPRKRNRSKDQNSKSNSSAKKSPRHSSKKRFDSPKKPSQSKRIQEKKDIDKPWREQNQTLIKSDQHIVREYEISEDLCGKIIGKNGKSVKEIHENTGATVCIECEKLGSKRVVSIAGLFVQVQNAEKILLSRFKSGMKKVGDELFLESLTSLDFVSLQCESTINVIVTAIVNAGNVFVQIFSDEVDEKLMKLQNDLAKIYASAPQKLMYANEFKPKLNDICVGLIDNTWCRLKVLEYIQDDQISVGFVDYGGVITVPWQTVLRVREEFLNVPAQGVQCYLSDVFPLSNQENYSYSANMTMNQLVEGKVLKAYVHYVEEGVPCIELFYLNEDTKQEVSVNESLLKWGLVAAGGYDVNTVELQSEE